jgi:uncharacterized membrane protein YczE
MNKYQKAALVDILKMVAIGLGVGITLNILALYFTAPQILFGIGMILMAYLGYTLFQIRVDQHKTLDELNNSRK